jgi:SpoVK/Ycf46/Vps4 family AAA+-type ATPase
VLVGPNGVGKSMIAQNIAHQANSISTDSIAAGADGSCIHGPLGSMPKPVGESASSSRNFTFAGLSWGNL